MEYKFKIGDKVKIIYAGCGCGYSSIGKTCTIKETGIYYADKLGYKIEEAIPETNAVETPLNSSYNGFIGEDSFELVKEATPEFLIFN